MLLPLLVFVVIVDVVFFCWCCSIRLPSAHVRPLDGFGRGWVVVYRLIVGSHAGWLHLHLWAVSGFGCGHVEVRRFVMGSFASLGVVRNLLGPSSMDWVEASPSSFDWWLYRLLDDIPPILMQGIWLEYLVDPSL